MNQPIHPENPVVKEKPASNDPRSLANALSQLIALRGWANSRGDAQLREGWEQVVPEEFRATTKPLKISRGVLQVTVKHATQLSELASFHRGNLLIQLQQRFPEWKVKEIKFKLG